MRFFNLVGKGVNKAGKRGTIGKCNRQGLLVGTVALLSPCKTCYLYLGIGPLYWFVQTNLFRHLELILITEMSRKYLKEDPH